MRAPAKLMRLGQSFKPVVDPRKDEQVRRETELESVS